MGSRLVIRIWLAAAAVIAVLLLLILGTEYLSGLRRRRLANLLSPVRAVPAQFAPGTHMPTVREIEASGRIDPGSFVPSLDLVRVTDERVWWESDNDEGDEEDDHLVHRSAELPLRRLIEAVSKNGGRLKVQDAYRSKGVHSTTSLHKEGRAVDVTCDGLSLERLAGLCWASGFDWVYYELSGGEHIHCSVRDSRMRP